MATTTAKAFDEFAAAIQLTEMQKATVTTRRDLMTGYLKEALPATSTLPLDRVVLIGSGARGTIVRPLDDVDVLAAFRNKDGIFETYRYDSQKFLYRVRDALKAVSSVKVVGARGQAVRFFYTTAPHVDVAPVFKWNGGGYALPAGDGTWLTTDPFVQADWINAKNEQLSYQLKPLVRLLKRWNRAHSSRLKSFHVEVMTASLFRSLGSNHRSALHMFFINAENWLSVSDPAGHGGDLSSSLTWSQREDIRGSFRSARDHAQKALNDEDAGKHAEAIRQWGIVLGDGFPAYG